MKQGDYILMLAGWYPHEDDPFNGDFVQRHAQSIALYRKVIVLFAVKTARVKEVTITEKHTGNLTELIYYYPPAKWFGKLFSLLHYAQAGRRLLRRVTRLHGSPAHVHVNIAWKAGLWALQFRRRFGWPFMVTENWTGYYATDPNFVRKQSLPVQQFIQRIFRQSRLFLPVTQHLGERCNQLFGQRPYTVVENAVNTGLFYYQPHKHEKIKLVHVSAMNYQKNTEGIIETVNRLAQRRNDFELWLIGPFGEAMRQCLSANPHAAALTRHTGNIPYTEVAQHLRSADIMVLFSRYENLPCVILEALCCGVPVVATRVGGIHEVIDETNGLLVEPENREELESRLEDMLNRHHLLPKEKFAAEAAAAFSFAAIGKKYIQVYDRLAGSGTV